MSALHERVMKHLDETEHIAQFDFQSGEPMEAGWARWQLQAWLPSMRRRAERHRPRKYARVDNCCKWCCHPEDCEEWPCQDFRDLCTEIGIEPEASQ